jgi:SpoVK/Ycf46/Vps4 family AAA+-type ATPase
MAGFKQVQQTFLMRKLVEFWKNVVKNYRGECHDDDFFDVVRDGVDHDLAVELVEAAYTGGEIDDMEHARYRFCRLDLSDSLDDVFQSLWNNERLRGKCRIVLETIADYMRSGLEDGGEDVLERRFGEVVAMLKLSELEAQILLMAYVRSQTCFCWPCNVDDRDKPLFYAMALDRSYGEVTEAMSAKSRLFKYNLLDGDFDFNFRTLGGYMDGCVDDAIVRRFYRKLDLADALPWEYYGDLAAHDGVLLRRLLSSRGTKCNILLHGAPGTGKSSFARTLAKELGRTAFEVMQGDDDGKNMRAEARMVGIQVCNEQEDADDGLMIIDEADELLRGGSASMPGPEFVGGRSTEKGVTNSLLDEMKLPAVWISNAPVEAMDESVRRRFDYSIRFERLNGAQRLAIWRNLVEKHALGGVISPAMIDGYAAKYETSAGGISTVLSNVARMKPAADEVDELISAFMKPHCSLMGVRGGAEFLPARDYSLDGLNIKGSVPLDMVVKAARNFLDASFSASAVDKPRMNILLFGPPGTGKTEWVKFLGRELDRKTLVVKGSDLLSKWVGESEQNIAAAFHRAESEHAVLFFDEVDGLLQDRAGAHASWEVTQVNELLQQAENFDGVMVAATNFAQNLDPATMRRFTFKLEFGYLDEAGGRTFFERMFKTPLADDEARELAEIHNLAPGDFRTVRQSLFYLGGDVTNHDRVAALRKECAMKKDGRDPARIGFSG